MTRAAKAAPRVDLEALAARAVALVTAHGAIPRAEWKAFRPHLGALEPLIAATGLELRTTTIRRPLARQIVELVRASSVVATKGIDKRVAGANAREVATAIDALVTSRTLVRVLRESGAGLALAEADIVDRETMPDLVRRLAKLQKLLRSATTKRAALLASDVATLLHPNGSARPIDPVAKHDARALVDEIARRVRSVALPLRIPDLLRALGAPFEDGRRALIEGAARGLFDLEPESGMGRLSLEDARLCPPGPMGTRLSWVRARTSTGATP